MDSARTTWIDLAWLLVIAVVSSSLCIHNTAPLGATFDEPFYIAKGLDCWRTGSYKPLMSAGTMPLPVDVQTLPLYLWERHRGEPFDPYAQLGTLLPIARLGNLPFWWLLLIYGMRWGRLLGGPWGGRFACGFLAFEPSLLAHAGLATTDIAITGTTLATAYHWYTGRNGNWRQRVLVPGLWYGVALVSKASAFAFVPILFVVLGCIPVWNAGVTWRTAWANTSQLRWDVFNAGLIGIVCAFAYCGSDWRTEHTFVEWATELPDGPTKRIMLPVSQNLSIFTNAGEGLAQQIKHNILGHGAYVLGEYHKRACWYYFPVALSVKLPEPMILLLALVLLTRPRAMLNPVGIATIALFLFSFNCRVQIGIRLVFPLLAFLLINVAVACTVNRSRLHFIAAWVALGSMVVINGVVGSQGLQYANQLWGGPSRCHEVLSDSNADWGQGLPELKTWWSRNNEPTLHVWYYGADSAVLLAPFHLVPIHQLKNATPDAVRQATTNGFLAVSNTLLDACPDRRPELLELIAWLKTQDVVARTSTFVIFRVS